MNEFLKRKNYSKSKGSKFLDWGHVILEGPLRAPPMVPTLHNPQDWEYDGFYFYNQVMYLAHVTLMKETVLDREPIQVSLQKRLETYWQRVEVCETPWSKDLRGSCMVDNKSQPTGTSVLQMQWPYQQPECACKWLPSPRREHSPDDTLTLVWTENPTRLYTEFWPPEIWNNKWVICYSVTEN